MCLSSTFVDIQLREKCKSDVHLRDSLIHKLNFFVWVIPNIEINWIECKIDDLLN